MIHIVINAHLLSAQTGYRSAGIHGYIYNTLRCLPYVTPDWHYTVLVGEGNPAEHPRMEIRHSRFSTRHPVQRIVWEQLVQPGVIRHLKPDVYHAAAFVSPVMMRVPSVVTVYDLSFIRYPQALSASRRLYLQTFTRLSCQRAAQVIAISESTARDIIDLLGVHPEKVTVAVPGVSEDFYPREPSEIQAFREKNQLPDRFILHLGTLEPRKNLPMLLRAYAALPESQREEVHLILAGGKGWEYADIFDTVKSCNLERVVHFPGYVAKDELPLWYNAAETLVYPSVFEGWGLPVVEAMACGCPTLVSDVSSLPEAAGNTGLRLPPDDETAWVEGLRHAITDTTWRAYSRQAGIERAKQFTWQATAAATGRAYEKALR